MEEEFLTRLINQDDLDEDVDFNEEEEPESDEEEDLESDENDPADDDDIEIGEE